PRRFPAGSCRGQARFCNRLTRAFPCPPAHRRKWAITACAYHAGCWRNPFRAPAGFRRALESPLCTCLSFCFLIEGRGRRKRPRPNGYICTVVLAQAHYILDALERGGGCGAYRVRALLEDVFQSGQVVHQFVVARLDGCQGGYQLLCERSFEIAVTLARELVLDLLLRLTGQQLVDAQQVVDAGAVRVERHQAL